LIIEIISPIKKEINVFNDYVTHARVGIVQNGYLWAYNQSTTNGNIKAVTAYEVISSGKFRGQPSTSFGVKEIVRVQLEEGKIGYGTVNDIQRIGHQLIVTISWIYNGADLGKGSKENYFSTNHQQEIHVSSVAGPALNLNIIGYHQL
jgi:hypothetical protein